MNTQRAFTLTEMTITLVLLSLLASVLVPRFVLISDSARDALVDGTEAALVGGMKNHRAFWMVSGTPGIGTTSAVNLNVDGIVVRYRNGYPVNTQDSNHVPVGTPNRNAASTRLFHLFLNPLPTPVIPRNSSGTGWVMLANGDCLAVPRRRCWEYRVNGARYARITYSGGTGDFYLD